MGKFFLEKCNGIGIHYFSQTTIQKPSSKWNECQRANPSWDLSPVHSIGVESPHASLGQTYAALSAYTPWDGWKAEFPKTSQLNCQVSRDSIFNCKLRLTACFALRHLSHSPGFVPNRLLPSFAQHRARWSWQTRQNKRQHFSPKMSDPRKVFRVQIFKCLKPQTFQKTNTNTLRLAKPNEHNIPQLCVATQHRW